MRYQTLIALAIAASLSAIASMSLVSCVPGAGRPNVILISIDTLRADHLGAYGFSRFPISPNFDQLAARSVLFTSAFSNASVTTASHMSMFTGLYPDEHRVHNIVLRSARAESLPSYLDPRVRTLPQLLKAEGYSTARFVFSRDFFLDPGLGFGRGIDVDFPFGLDSQASAAAIGKWISERGGEPFFAFIHSKRPHAPYVFPEEVISAAEADGRLDAYKGPLVSSSEKFAERFRQQGWFGNFVPGIVPDCWFFEGLIRKGNADDKKRAAQLYALGVQQADAYLGKVLGALEASGKMSNTIVVITSDHGEQLLQRDTLSHMGLYREETHVPLLVFIPESLKGGGRPARVNADVQSIDILPTVSALAGIPAPRGISGKDLGPLVRGETAKAHDELFSLNRYGAIAPSSAVRTAAWALVQDEETGPQLFDRAADPGETRNVAGAHADVVSDLQARLKRKELQGFSFEAAP